MVMTFGENAVDRKSKKEAMDRGESAGTIKISHPALEGLNEGDYATVRVCVVKPGKSCTVDVMSVEPEENAADASMQKMIGDKGGSGAPSASSDGDDY